MMGEQEAFQKQLDKLERVINGFGKYTDLGKVEDIANPNPLTLTLTLTP